MIISPSCWEQQHPSRSILIIYVNRKSSLVLNIIFLCLTGKRVLENEIGEAQLISDSLQKELETCKTKILTYFVISFKVCKLRNIGLLLLRTVVFFTVQTEADKLKRIHREKEG